MKGGIVCFIIAYKALLSLGFKPAAPLYFHAVIEEECTGTSASRPSRSHHPRGDGTDCAQRNER